MTITPTEAEVILDAIESALIDVHTMLPGKIESYSALLQTATVQLQVKRTLPKGDGSYATEPLPVLQNVPVQFLRTNAAMFTLPIKKGDFGSVVFSEMSLDQWRSKAAETSPGDVGRHTLTGAVFVPGLMPLKETILPTSDDVSTDVIMGFIGAAQLRAKPGGTIEAVAGGISGQSADDFVVMATRLLTAIGVMLAAGVAAGGAGAANFIAAKGAWDALIATPAGDIASENLKANNAVVP